MPYNHLPIGRTVKAFRTTNCRYTKQCLVISLQKLVKSNVVQTNGLYTIPFEAAMFSEIYIKRVCDDGNSEKNLEVGIITRH
jgi:hypothetical protein